MRAEGGRFGEAAGHVEPAIPLSPTDADLHVNLAQLRWDFGDPAAARLAAAQALAPSHRGAQRLLAKLQRVRARKR